MPELPEVETIRRDLEGLIVGKKFAGVVVRKPKMVRGKKRNLERDLTGTEVTGVDRVGKLLIIRLAGEKLLLVHLKMTGQLIYRRGQTVAGGGHSEVSVDTVNLPGKHTHFIFTFSDQGELFFNDIRQFGYVDLKPADREEEIKAKFGFNPLSKEFTAKALQEILCRRKTSLKAVLLNQQLIAGLGNIYVDEACFIAGIKPDRRADTINQEEAERLVKAIKQVLKKSIKYRGTTFNNFRDSNGQRGNFLKFLQVYRRGGEPCPVCGMSIKRIKLAGRGTHYCPKCQK